MAKATEKKSKKTKRGLQVSVNVPDDKHMKHIADAYGLVCQYRTANKAPHESMENWLLRLVVEGCNALYQYHNANIKKREEDLAKQAEEKTEKEEEGEEASE